MNEKLYTNRRYIFYFLLCIFTFLEIFTIPIINDISAYLDNQKDKIISEKRKVLNYINNCSKLEKELKKYPIKELNEQQAKLIVLKFIEQLKKYVNTGGGKNTIHVFDIKENKSYVEVEIKLEIISGKKRVQKLLKVFANSLYPIINIKKMVIKRDKRILEIKLIQPYIRI